MHGILNRLITVLLMLAAISPAYGSSLETFTVYDPEIHGLHEVHSYAPCKADDMVAKFALITGENGETILEVTFEGTDVEAASAQPRIGFNGFKLPDGYILKYFRMLLDCDAPLISLGGAVMYPGGHDLFPAPANKSGMNELFIHPNNLDDFNQRDYAGMAVWTKSVTPYRIYKIEAVAEKISGIDLPLTARGPILEILPTGMPPAVVDLFRKDTGIIAGTLEAAISYTPDEITFNIHNTLGRQPVAEHNDNDCDVWKDECHEIFFSPAANEIDRYQFTINSNGAIYDSKYAFNDTAGSIINDLSYTMRYTGTSKFDNGIWYANYTFPFEQFRFDPAVNRFMTFRIGQWITSPEQVTTYPELYNSSFLDPSQYAIAVFNPEPFGNGWLDIDRMSVINDSTAITVSGRTGDLQPGEYSLELRLLRPSGDIRIIKKPFSAAAEINDFSITYTGACPAGKYVAYLLLTNAKGATLINAVSGEFNRPVQVMEEALLHPFPKEVNWHDGCFSLTSGSAITIPQEATERTKLTAEQFSELLFGASGIKREITISPADIELKLADGPPQGYNITVTPDKAVITGFDEAGLYYGTRMFIQLYNSGMRTLAGRPVPCCEINDWPDIGKRMGILVTVPGSGYFSKNKSLSEKRTVEIIKEHITHTFIANRFNYLILDMTETVELPRHPEMNDCPFKEGTGNIASPIYTMEDLKEVAEFCKDNFIEIIPSLPYHRNPWIYRNHQDLSLYNIYHDVEHPDYDRIYFGVADELLDAFEEVAPVNYFFTDLSELFLDVPHDELMKIGQKDPVGRFERGINKINDFCAARGIRMMMYSDMLNPYWPAVFPYSTVIDRIPREVALCHWQTDTFSDDGPVKYFYDKGFEVWGMGSCLQDKLSPDGRKYLTAYGKGCAYFGDAWQAYDDDSGEYWSPNALFYAGNYGWNLSRQIADYSDMKADGSIQKARQTASITGNPAASEKIDIVDLSAAVNANIDEYAAANFPGGKADFPEDVVDICNIPMYLGSDFVLLGPGASFDYPLQKHLSSLIFLLAGHLPGNNTDNVYGLNYIEYTGAPAGEFIVRYADGTEELIPLRQHWNYDYIDQHPEMRATRQCRYAHLIPRAGGGYYTLHQYEWVNPHPDKKVVSLGYRHDYPPRDSGAEISIRTMLFSLSARGISASGTDKR